MRKDCEYVCRLINNKYEEKNKKLKEEGENKKKIYHKKIKYKVRWINI